MKNFFKNYFHFQSEDLSQLVDFNVKRTAVITRIFKLLRKVFKSNFIVLFVLIQFISLENTFSIQLSAKLSQHFIKKSPYKKD